MTDKSSMYQAWGRLDKALGVSTEDILDAMLLACEALEAAGRLKYVASTPDGLDWFDTRKEAEAAALEWFREQLADTGEGVEESGFVFAVVSVVDEVIDSSPAGAASAAERDVDYWISGYEVRRLDAPTDAAPTGSAEEGS